MVQEITDDGYLHIKVPEKIRGKVELTIVCLEDNSTDYIKPQEKS